MQLANSIWTFLTATPLGLVVMSIVASILGGIIYEILKKECKTVLRKYRYQRFVKYLVKTATAHVHGQRAAIVSLGAGAKQSFWAADYIISFVKSSVIILAVLLITIIIMIIIPPIFYWVPICAASIFITIKIRLIKRNLRYFDMSVDMIFGKEYLEKEKEGYIEYWDQITKRRKVDNKHESTSEIAGKHK